MSAEMAAIVEGVGKCYHIYDKPTDRLKQSLLLGQRRYYREFWALRNLNFTVRKGETVGIVGANGSGKSTLLQLLHGVLAPTTGRLHVSGRIGGLLELGAGFNPEETGRENLLINAAILGIPPAEIPAMCERVLAFADIGKFIDQPVKVYSSGMAVRLAFALHISAPKDILIIDEALAVGDELFQRRCHAALEEFKDGGGTILFVSHAAPAVKQLCETGIFLDAGEMVQWGPSKTVIDSYQKFLYMREPERSRFRAELMKADAAEHAAAAAAEQQAAASDVHPAPPPQRVAHADTYVQGIDRQPGPPGFEEGLVPQTTTVYQQLGARIENVRIETLTGERVNVLNRMERYRLCYGVTFDRPARNVLFGNMLKTTSGLELGGGAHDTPDQYLRDAQAGSHYEVAFEFTAALLPGVYFFNCSVMGTTDGHDGFLHRIVDAIAFRINNAYTRIFSGFVDFDYVTTVRQTPPGTAAAPPASGAQPGTKRTVAGTP